MAGGRWHDGPVLIHCAAVATARGCGPCTHSEKTRKSAQRIFSRLRDKRTRRAGLSPAPTVKAALRCRARLVPRARFRIPRPYSSLAASHLCVIPSEAEGPRLLLFFVSF